MDKMLLLGLQDWANPWLDVFFAWLSDQYTFTLPLLLVVAGLVVRRFKLDGLKAWGLLLVLIFITDTTGRGIKALTQQPRPCQDMYEELYYPAGHTMTPCGFALNGMPSNHALSFFAAALSTLLVVRRRGWTLFILAVAVLVGISRVYLGKHYPSQVLAGSVLGSMMGWAYAWLCLRYFLFLRRMGERPVKKPL